MTTRFIFCMIITPKNVHVRLYKNPVTHLDCVVPWNMSHTESPFATAKRVNEDLLKFAKAC